VFEFITHKSFLTNFLVIVFIIVVCVFLFFTSLDWITNHNETKKVPLVVNKNITEATNLLKQQGFKVQIVDSVYVDTAEKSTVIRQSPEADATVKPHRTIYLTVNRAVAPLIEMPDLRGFSFLSAKMYLQNLGLKTGDTIYRPDIARNSVLEQHYQGKPIAPGTKISMGSTIDLVLGNGVGNELMNVPNLIGMRLSEAQDYVKSLNINIGAIVADNNVQNQADAFVYKQNPEPQTVQPSGEKVENKIRPGQVIDVWIGVQQPVQDTASASF
jgi:hypothetical protein